jgi:hypothetical protein
MVDSCFHTYGFRFWWSMVGIFTHTVHVSSVFDCLVATSAVCFYEMYLGPPIYVPIYVPLYVLYISPHPRPTRIYDISLPWPTHLCNTPYVGPPIYIMHPTSAHPCMKYTLHQPTRLYNNILLAQLFIISYSAYCPDGPIHLHW